MRFRLSRDFYFECFWGVFWSLEFCVFYAGFLEFFEWLRSFFIDFERDTDFERDFFTERDFSRGSDLERDWFFTRGFLFSFSFWIYFSEKYLTG